MNIWINKSTFVSNFMMHYFNFKFVDLLCFSNHEDKELYFEA